MMCTNMTGTEKLPSLIIGKAKHPFSLKKGVTLAQLVFDYYQNERGWMTLASFSLRLKTWNEKLAKMYHFALGRQCSITHH